MSKKAKVIKIEHDIEGKGRRVPKQRYVNLRLRLDEDIAERLLGENGYPFDKLTHSDKIKRAAPLLWRQLEREMDRWQRRPGGPKDPRS
ncbi:MAG: hypothetical protein ACYDDN_03755 [Candidatus Desulforudaceae bacterium]